MDPPTIISTPLVSTLNMSFVKKSWKKNTETSAKLDPNPNTNMIFSFAAKHSDVFHSLHT